MGVAVDSKVHAQWIHQESDRLAKGGSAVQVAMKLARRSEVQLTVQSGKSQTIPLTHMLKLHQV